MGLGSSKLGEVAVWWVYDNEALELCALGFRLPGIRFFFSLLGCLPLLSDGNPRKMLGRFRSLVGVGASWGTSSNLSWLRPVTGARVGVRCPLPLISVERVDWGDWSTLSPAFNCVKGSR